MSDDAAPEKRKVGGKKLGRPPGVKETNPRRPQQGFVPPDGPDERGMVRQPQGGAIQPRYGTNHPMRDRVPSTSADYNAGLNPRAIRRQAFAILNAALPEIMEKGIELAKGGPNVDQRVQAMMIEAALNRQLGKAGDLPQGIGEDAAQGGSFDMTLLTPDERAEVNHHVNEVKRITDAAKARAAANE